MVLTDGIDYESPKGHCGQITRSRRPSDAPAPSRLVLARPAATVSLLRPAISLSAASGGTGSSRPVQPGDRMNPHEPVRPAWWCATCDEAWPCQRRREQLIIACEGSRLRLALILAEYFCQATEDRPDLSPSTLYSRFLGWLRT